MLQNLFYLFSIVSSSLTIIVLLVALFLLIKLYKTINAAIEKAQAKAEELSNLATEIGERGAGLLQMATEKGQRAATASTILSAAMNSFFLLRTIFGKRK